MSNTKKPKNCTYPDCFNCVYDDCIYVRLESQDFENKEFVPKDILMARERSNRYSKKIEKR